MKAPRIHVFQHVPFEDPGCLTEWFNQHQCSVGYTRFYEADFQFPEMDSFDRLVVMGGPMSVTDEALFPWLKDEKMRIKSAIEAGKSVVGICLGAQLIACSLGEKVYPNKLNEIGWFPVFKTENGKASSLLYDFNDETVVFHWHGDTFDIPRHAKHLFYSKACPNQSFLIGNQVLALQFHLEVTEESLENMLLHVDGGLKEDRYVQSPEVIRSNKHRTIANNQLLFRLMDQLG